MIGLPKMQNAQGIRETVAFVETVGKSIERNWSGPTISHNLMSGVKGKVRAFVIEDKVEVKN